MRVNKPKHISKIAQQNFWVYVKFRRRGDRMFCPWQCLNFERGNEKTLTCFTLLENGILSENPREPRLLKVALEGKRLLNWQIKQWAEGIAEGLFFIDELRNEFCFPEWVWNAIKQQATKLKSFQDENI